MRYFKYIFKVCVFVSTTCMTEKVQSLQIDPVQKLGNSQTHLSIPKMEPFEHDKCSHSHYYLLSLVQNCLEKIDIKYVTLTFFNTLTAF